MVDEVTWNDLEMDEVFLRINNTKSYIGEQVLYYKLHDISTIEDWIEMEKQVEYVTQNESARIAIEERLGCIGKREDDYLKGDSISPFKVLFWTGWLLFFGINFCEYKKMKMHNNKTEGPY